MRALVTDIKGLTEIVARKTCIKNKKMTDSSTKGTKEILTTKKRRTTKKKGGFDLPRKSLEQHSRNQNDLSADSRRLFAAKRLKRHKKQ